MVGWGLPYKFSTGATMGMCENPTAGGAEQAISAWCTPKAVVPKDSTTPLECYPNYSHTESGTHPKGIDSRLCDPTGTYAV